MQSWSIGLFEGSSPFDLSPIAGAGPVLDRHSVRDLDAGFVADPFAVRRAGVWHLFYEVFERDRNRGVIACASGEDPLRLQHHGVILREEFHLSYPMVFQHEDAVYMVPE